MRLILLLLMIILLGMSPAQANTEIVINIPEYRLALYDKGEVVKSYDIAVGTLYEQTPTGSYSIFYKEQFPTWFPGPKFEDPSPVPAGPDNPLGTRWMEFHPTFGIHGTNKGWDIQYPVSGGCIRMHDKDAQDLYERVLIGTPVIILYETILFEDRPDGLYVKVVPDIYNRKVNTPERFLNLYASYSGRYPGVAVPTFPQPGEDINIIVATKIAIPKTPSSLLIPPKPMKTKSVQN